MQKNIIKRQVATKAFQHNAKFYLSFPQQLPVITAPEEPPRRPDGIKSEQQGRDRAGLAQQGKSCAYRAAAPMHTSPPKPWEGLQHHSRHRAASSPSSQPRLAPGKQAPTTIILGNLHLLPATPTPQTPPPAAFDIASEVGAWLRRKYFS